MTGSSKQVDDLIEIALEKSRKIPPPTWRGSIKTIWEVHPLICSKCGGELHIISFIDEAQGLRRILESLGLWSDTPCGKPPPDTCYQDEPVCQPFDDGWGEFDEPSSVTLNRDFQRLLT